MAIFEKHFTLAEANATLPWLRQIFTRVHAIMDSVAAAQGGVKPALTIPRPKANGNGNGNGHGQPDENVKWRDLPSPAKVELANGLLRAVMKRGIVIQDVARILVDFPSMRDGEEVMLCYEGADGDEIAYWHPVADGYDARQPIDETWD